MRIQFFFNKLTKSISCYKIKNFSTILTKKFVTFDWCIVTLLKNINSNRFEKNFRRLNKTKTFYKLNKSKNKFKRESKTLTTIVNIVDIITLTTLIKENIFDIIISVLITTTTINVVTQTTINFLNQLFLCVDLSFLIVKNFTFSTFSKLIWKTFEKFNSIIRFNRKLRKIWIN